uniref:Candidate secreted effector n=2 Tax=Meloidogyne TaxID=189290 RepID=A0A914KSG1_MELIC
MSVPFYSCVYGLAAPNDCSSQFSAGIAIFCITISAIWCFCSKKKAKEPKKKPPAEEGTEAEEERKTFI